MPCYLYRETYLGSPERDRVRQGREEEFARCTASLATSPAPTTSTMAGEIEFTGARIPHAEAHSQTDPPIKFTIYWASSQPVDYIGAAGDMFIELGRTPTLYIKLPGTRKPTIAWRLVPGTNRKIFHPNHPTLCASGSPYYHAPTWAPDRDYNGNLQLATAAFMMLYGPGTFTNPIDLTPDTAGTSSNPIDVE